MKFVLNAIDQINEYVGRIFCWTLIVLNFIVVSEVVLRYLFNRPTVCNFEITKQLFGLYFMIAAGFTLKHGGHVSIDIVYEKLSKKVALILDLCTYLLFFFPFWSIVLFYGIKFAAASWRVFETEWSVCGSPLYLIKTVIPVSALLILLQGLAIFIRHMKRVVGIWRVTQ